jgi:hypothetical protein
VLAKAVVDLDVALVVAHCIAVGADVVVLDAERVGSGLVGEWIKLGKRYCATGLVMGT